MKPYRDNPVRFLALATSCSGGRWLMVDRMRTRQTGKRKKTSSLVFKVSHSVISPRSRKMLDHSAANLKKGVASPPIAKSN